MTTIKKEKTKLLSPNLKGKPSQEKIEEINNEFNMKTKNAQSQTALLLPGKDAETKSLFRTEPSNYYIFGFYIFILLALFCLILHIKKI